MKVNRVSAVAVFVLLIGGLTGGAAFHKWMPDRCTPPTEADKSRLIDFVHIEYKLPPSSEIGLADAGLVFASCFRKMVFTSLSGSPFRVELFVSPDFRFVTDKLLDARPDPKKAAEQERQAAESLTRGNPPVRGTAKAPVTLALFSDFQCPYCARMANVLDDLTKSEGEILRIVYHYFPLSSIHPWANQAAQAAACSQRQGNAAFWSLHDFLFAHQRQLAATNLKERINDWVRATPNLDRERFERCVSESLTSGQIEQDIALGQEIGVHGTPTVFLNGQRVDAASENELRSLIRRAATAR